jgi:hypothetical protein
VVGEELRQAFDPHGGAKVDKGGRGARSGVACEAVFCSVERLKTRVAEHDKPDKAQLWRQEKKNCQDTAFFRPSFLIYFICALQGAVDSATGETRFAEALLPSFYPVLPHRLA